MQGKKSGPVGDGRWGIGDGRWEIGDRRRGSRPRVHPVLPRSAGSKRIVRPCVIHLHAGPACYLLSAPPRGPYHLQQLPETDNSGLVHPLTTDRPVRLNHETHAVSLADAIDRRKDALLDEISRQLEQKSKCEALFTLRWRLA